MRGADTGAQPLYTAWRGLYGRVAYTFGSGLDHPLSIHRFHRGDTLFVQHATSAQQGIGVDPLVIFPHANWRGDYELGTYEGGRTDLCVSYPSFPKDQAITGAEPGYAEPGGSQTTRYCFAAVDWPSANVWMDHGLRSKRSGIQPGFWAGSLVSNKRDLTGQLYMRNRYYDPKSGRFTQEDPIGIAGGLNVYGFANGDPVSFNDPFGLRPCKESTSWIDCLAIGLSQWGGRNQNSYALYGGAAISAAAEASGLNALATAGDHIGNGRFAEGGTELAFAIVPGGPRARVVQGQISHLTGRLRGQLAKLDLRHLRAARDELSGTVTGWDHVTEVREGMNGLLNTMQRARRLLGDERLTAEERQAIQTILSAASIAHDRAERMLR